jgi:hypothetical protein
MIIYLILMKNYLLTKISTHRTTIKSVCAYLIILEYLHIQNETAMCLLPVSDYFLY